MAAFSKWKCERCGFTVETSGPHEFYRDDHGELRPYGHPHAVSIEAKEKGGKGFNVQGYCTKCDAVKVTITAEFDNPVYEGWWHTTSNEVKYYKPICTECGTRLILNYAEKPCPKCGNMFHGPAIPAFS